MKKVLIATLYSKEPVMLAATKLSPDKLFLLIDDMPDASQQKSLEFVKQALKHLDIKPIKTSMYDIVKVAERCVQIIDDEDSENIIYVNITSGRKPKALGLLFAAYMRSHKVKKIAYNPEEDKNSVIYLPKMKFSFTDSQNKILDFLATGKIDGKNYTQLAADVDMSTAMFYRAVDELKDMALVEKEPKLQLTDFGKIARL